MEKPEEFHFPPGFRFHPSDEELIVHYLLNKVNLRQLPASVIGEIELYNHNPWELPKKALFGEDEWYFFSPRDRKYPNGTRPNRAAGSGFWKATGTDKPIFTSSGSRKIGVKKALVFYSGHPPKGVKTDWIMNEYRLPESSSRSSRPKGSMRLDDWVLCRVRQKGNMSKNGLEVEENQKNKLKAAYLPTMIQELPSYTITDHHHRRLEDFRLMASILAGHDLPSIIETTSTEILQGTKNNVGNCLVHENSCSGKENSPFVSNEEENMKHEDILSGNMVTADESYNEYCSRYNEEEDMFDNEVMNFIKGA